MVTANVHPLMLPRPAGFGYLLTRPGETLNNGRYEIIRMLGRGTASSTFLCADRRSHAKKYSAVKVLTANATQGNKARILQELEIMQAVSALDDNDYLPILYDHFEHDGPHGRHLCLVMEPLTTDISNFRRTAPRKALPVHTVKMVIIHVLEALKALHEAKIIHADVKPDNILFCIGNNADRIDCELESTPLETDGDIEVNGVSYPVMQPQPLKHDFQWDDGPNLGKLYVIHLIDLGHSMWVDKERTMQVVGPFALRAPEVILHAPFGTAIDVWALGCIAFELLTGRWAFNPEAGKTWSVEDDHLAKMMELTGEIFPPELLAQSQKREHFFAADGQLRSIDTLYPVSIREALMNYQILEPDQVEPAASFIGACLRLNPEHRLSADALINHDWMRGAFSCDSYYLPRDWHN